MNFVILSWNFLPDTNPEAACATRFASALADAGHYVKVICCDQGGGIPDRVVKQLLSPKVIIDRVKKPVFSNPLLKILDRCFGLRFWTSLGTSLIEKKVIEALKEVDNPILISRSDPICSSIVAWRCRGYAKKWIAHFSDPCPYASFARFSNLVWSFAKGCTARVLRDADKIVVTCGHVKRWFASQYPSEYLEKKFVVTTHIGDPTVEPAEARVGCSSSNVKIVSHCGYFGPSRYLLEICDALSHFKYKDNIRLLLVGNFGQKTIDAVSGTGVEVEAIKVSDPGQVTTINSKSSVILVADTRDNRYSFSPFLPSKFVYSLYTTTPIVACTKVDSPMSDIAQRFPGSGIFLGDPEKPGSLNKAIEEALSCAKVDDLRREKVREYFSARRIILEYLKAVAL